MVTSDVDAEALVSPLPRTPPPLVSQVGRGPVGGVVLVEVVVGLPGG